MEKEKSPHIRHGSVYSVRINGKDIYPVTRRVISEAKLSEEGRWGILKLLFRKK